MSVKQELLKLLEKNIDNYISGEQAAVLLGCSRAAVWKAVRSLCSEGYSITASTNKGYCLCGETDILCAEEIIEAVRQYVPEIDIRTYKTLDSTNSEIRRLLQSGAAEWTVVISDEQSEGKGRMGRRFYSPERSGLYMSILLKPKLSPEKSVRITTAAAVAAAEAIERVFGKSVGIKWVNDLYLENRKVCGILTEAVYSMENNELESAILGIGVDLYESEESLPDEIKDIVGNLLEKKQWSARNRLAAEILKIFKRYYDALEQGSYVDSYRRRLLYKGERVTVISGEKRESATLIDIDDECRIRVKYDNGKEATLCSGEISVRKEL